MSVRGVGLAACIMVGRRPVRSLAVAPPFDLRVVGYPIADLLALFAMGLYRRDMILEAHKALVRVPFVVGMGGLLALLASVVLPVFDAALFLRPTVQEQAMLFAVAAVCFSCTAFSHASYWAAAQAARAHRAPLVVGAGQRAWDLLHMLSKEGGNLQYDITFLHDPALGEVDARLAADPAGRIISLEDFGVLRAARDVDADQIVIAPDERRGMNLERLLECKTAGFPVVQYLSFVEKEIRRVDIKRMEIGWLLYPMGFTLA